MITQKVLATGKFYPQDFLVNTSLSNRKIEPSIENQLDKLWQVKLEDAKAKGKNIYNGLSYRLNSLRQEGGKLTIDFGEFDFKTRECLIEADGYYQLSEEHYRKGCHTLGTVKTSDDKYLMVEMSGKSMNTNSVDFLGGVMETNLKMHTSEDIFQSFYNELEEEGCIAVRDIQDIYIRLIYLSNNTNVGFYFEVSLSISSNDLLERFYESRKDVDIKSLKVLSKYDYLETLRNHNLHKQFVAQFVNI